MKNVGNVDLKNPVWRGKKKIFINESYVEVN